MRNDSSAWLPTGIAPAATSAFQSAGICSALAQRASSVTMLQRSPSYILSVPAEDHIARTIRKLLPERIANRLARWKNILLSIAFYQLCRRAPARAATGSDATRR